MTCKRNRCATDGKPALRFDPSGRTWVRLRTLAPARYSTSGGRAATGLAGTFVTGPALFGREARDEMEHAAV